MGIYYDAAHNIRWKKQEWIEALERRFAERLKNKP
jgi:hypothetical protein